MAGLHLALPLSNHAVIGAQMHAVFLRQLHHLRAL
ncbi:MAG: hypothetical protein RL180_773 [Pseudomonadota bacterium]|jgi:hypothetical protein